MFYYTALYLKYQNPEQNAAVAIAQKKKNHKNVYFYELRNARRRVIRFFVRTAHDGNSKLRGEWRVGASRWQWVGSNGFGRYRYSRGENRRPIKYSERVRRRKSLRRLRWFTPRDKWFGAKRNRLIYFREFTAESATRVRTRKIHESDRIIYRPVQRV